MNLNELSLKMKERLGRRKVPAVVAQSVMRLFLEEIAAELESKGRVQIAGFGTFEVRKRKPRRIRDIRDGHMIRLPPSTTVGFRPAWRLLVDATHTPAVVPPLWSEKGEDQ